MENIAADVDGLAIFARHCLQEGEVLAAGSGDAPPGVTFQPTTAAVTALHGGVAAARRVLIERMAATSERVAATAGNYTSTEESATRALQSCCQR